MMNMYDGYNLFANTTFAVTAASLAVIRDRILSCEWNAEKLYGTLTFWDREVPTIFHASAEGKKVEKLYFSCKLRFLPNEIPGILTYFNVFIQAEVSYNEENGKHHFLVYTASSMERSDRDALDNEAFDNEEDCVKYFLQHMDDYINPDFDAAKLIAKCNLDSEMFEWTNTPLFDPNRSDY